MIAQQMSLETDIKMFSKIEGDYNSIKIAIVNIKTEF